MRQNDASGKPETQLRRSLSSISTFLNSKTHWLTAGSIMLLAASGYLFYFFIKRIKKSSNLDNLHQQSSRTREQEANKVRTIQQANNLVLARDKTESIMRTSLDNSEEIQQSESLDQYHARQFGDSGKEGSKPFLTITWPEYKSTTKWMNALNSWMLSNFSMTQIRMVASFLAWPLFAILLAYLAQAILNVTLGDGITLNWDWLNALPESSRLWLGVIIFLVSMVIWMFTSPNIPVVSEKIAQLRNFTIKSTRYNPIRFCLLIGSIIIFLISILSYIEFNETASIRILWVLGLILFILSQVPWPALFHYSHPNAEESPRFQWKNWVILALILGVAFWLRFYQVSTLPDDIHGDAASFGLQVRDIMQGNDPNLFDIGWADIPKIGFLPATFSMLVFGNNIFGLRMTSVIGGLFNILAIYLLIWRLFNRHRLAAITSSLVAINILHIHFSRIGPGYTDPWLFCFFALFFLIDGLKGRRPGSLGLAGVFLAFGINMYFPGKVVPEIIGAFLLCTFFIRRPWITENKKGLVLFVLGFVIAMGPSLIYNIINWQAIITRLQIVVVYYPANIQHLSNKYGVTSLFDILLTQTRLTFLMFNYYTDTSSQFGYPHAMFSPLISPLIILGLGAAIRRWKEPGVYLALIWLGFMVVMGSILTIDSPFWPRMVGIVPVVALMIALAIDQIIEFGNKYFHKGLLILKTSLVVIFLVIVGWSSWIQYYTFAQSNGAPMAVIGRYLSRLPLNITACGLFNGPPLLSVRETYFQVWPRKIVDIKTDGPDSDLTACSGSSLVWVISPENKDRLQAIRALWPEGIEQEYTIQNNYVVTYYFVGVPIPQIPVSNPYLFPKSTSKLFSFIFIGISFAGALTWVIWKRKKVIKFLDLSAWRKKMIVELPRIRITWRAVHPKQTIKWVIFTIEASWHEFTSNLNSWYSDLYKFDISKYSPQQIVTLAITLLLPLVVVGLAYFGQIILDQGKIGAFNLSIDWVNSISENQRLEISGGIFIIAAILWGLLTTHKKHVSTQMNNQEHKDSSNELHKVRSMPVPETTSQIIGRLEKVVGLLCTFGSMFLYMVVGENSFIRWLWLIGLGFFFLSLFKKNETDHTLFKEESPSFKWSHLVILAGLLALAFYLRVYRLNDIPLELSTDMASIGLSAREYLFGFEQRIFGIGWFYMPRISFLPYVASLKLIGDNLFGLYFPAVIMGTLNILACYLFIWRLFDQHRLAIITAIIMVISPAHINYSRIISYMDPWFFGFFALFFLVDGLKGLRKKSLAFAGILTGITVELYPSGKVIIPIIGIFLACIWFYRRQWILNNRDGFLGMVLGFLVIMGPNLVFMITNWANYMARTNEVIIFDPEVIRHLKTVYKVDTLWMIFWEQLKHSVFLFNYYPDLSAQSNYPHPMYNSLISPMLILGLGTAIFRRRKPEYLITIASFILILVTGSVLTVNAPTWTRLVGIIPFSALLIAFAFNEFFNIFDRLSWNVLTPFLSLSLILFFSLLGFVDWNNYIQAMNIARPVVYVSRYLASLPNDVNACGITDGFDLNYPEVTFLAWPRTTVVISPEIKKFTADSCPGSKIIWILTQNYVNRLPEIENEWPGGISQEHQSENGEFIFTSYMVSGISNP
ncbi:MAG: glycosyltransferase family 39 protein [Anaerolineaceae bacterium]